MFCNLQASKQTGSSDTSMQANSRLHGYPMNCDEMIVDAQGPMGDPYNSDCGDTCGGRKRKRKNTQASTC